ncbi:MAG: metallophosphoesterase family protein [Actinomycetota bacterium]
MHRHRPRAAVAAVTTGLLIALAACEPSADPAPTGPPYRPVTGEYPVVAAAGDIACPPDETCESARATADLLARIDPEAVLALGDNQYTWGTLAEFEASYDRTWGAFKDLTHPVPGNHEYRTPGGAGYFAYFGALSGPPGGNYSFDLEGWHLVAINSAFEDAITDRQLDWVRADLDGSDGRCELAFWHHPRFSSGAVEGDDPVPELGPLWTLLNEQGVDVVLNGHAHQYERFAPLDADGRLDEATGIREFVVGTGGRTPHGFEEELVTGSEVQLTDVYGVLELVLRPRAYSWGFVSTDGVLDRGVGDCH